MLVLKLVDKNLKSYGGFQWPESGPVKCADWSPRAECGNGLHGWANGCGSYRHSFNEGHWLAVEVEDSSVVDLNGKVKFPAGNVVFSGNKTDAVAYLIDKGALNSTSNPAYACFTKTQLVELAMRSADRAVRQHAPRRLRARGLIEAAERLERLPKIVDRKTALNGRVAAYADAYAAAYAAEAAADAAAYAAAAYAAEAAADADAYAAAYAAEAADAADAAAYAAAYAAEAAADADAAAAAYAAEAADAADAYAAAAYAAEAAAADAAAFYARQAEREAHRRDKLELLGIVSAAA